MHYTVSKLRCLIREVCGMPTSYLEDVLSTARLAHMGQVRRSGEPYIKHPEAVADIVYAYYGDKSLCAAALLHDALEDAPRLGTVETEADMAAMIAGSFTNSDMGNDILMIVHMKRTYPMMYTLRVFRKMSRHFVSNYQTCCIILDLHRQIVRKLSIENLLKC